jgi:uncharacterized Zn ribbon protein
MKVFLLSCFVFSALIFSSTSDTAQAQDPGMMAAQQAMQATEQANQQAMQASMQASQQSMQDAQNAAMNQGPTIAMTRAPKFSSNSGNVKAGTLVRLTSPTHYATIYYTTDGWSPTTKSKKYTGPVKINHDTTLQAMAIAPNMTHSLIVRAEYKVPGASAVLPATLSTDGVLHAGARLRLATAVEMNSKAVQVGDKLPLQLDQDITAGDKVIIAKGTTVEAVVTQADPPGRVGAPGDIVFEVTALVANGITIPVSGGETMEGQSHLKRAVGMILIPVVGPATLLAHGGEAVIKPGMTFCVTVQTDTPLLSTAAAGAGSL